MRRPGTRLAELDEERLQTAGGNQCQCPHVLTVQRQQVRYVSWAKDERPRSRAERVVTDAHAEISLEDEERLVFPMVNVGGRLHASGEHAFHQTEGASGLLRAGENGDQLPHGHIRGGIPDIDSKR